MRFGKKMSSKDKALGMMDTKAKAVAVPTSPVQPPAHKLSESEKRDRKVEFRVTLHKKMINGKPVVSGTLHRTPDYGTNPAKDGKQPQQPMEQEFTDMQAMGEHVKTTFESLTKELEKGE